MLTLFTSKKCFNSTFLLQYNVQLTLRIVHEFLYQTKIRTALQAMVETALEVAPALGQDLADMLRLQENNWFCKLNSLVQNAAKSHPNCRHVTTFIHMICPRYFSTYFFWRVHLKNFCNLQPDYEDIEDEAPIALVPTAIKSDKGKDKKKYDDPYYCGMRARVPNFGKSSKKDKKEKEKEKDKEKEKEKDKQKQMTLSKRPVQLSHPASFTSLYQLHQMQNHTLSKQYHFNMLHQQPQFQFRSFESGIGEWNNFSN